MNLGRSRTLGLAGEVVAPVGCLARVDIQMNCRPGIKFFQRHSNDAGENVRIKLRFAMQDLARNGQCQLHDLGFDPAVVTLPLQRKLLKRAFDLVTMFAKGCTEFGAELLLRTLASLLEALGSLTAIFFFGRMDGVRGTGHSSRLRPRRFGFGVGKGNKRTVGCELSLRSARRHTPPATRRSRLVCPRIQVFAPLPQCHVAPDAHPSTGPRPELPCLLSAYRRLVTTWI